VLLSGGLPPMTRATTHAFLPGMRAQFPHIRSAQTSSMQRMQPEYGTMNRKTLKFLAIPLACVTIGASIIATTGEAEARWRGRYGGAVAAGVIGGLALGALAASAARPSYAYPAPVYVDGPYCYKVRERVFVRGYGWTTRRTTVCE